MNRKVLSVLALVLVFALTLLAGCQKAPANNNNSVDPAQAVASIKDKFLSDNADNLPAFMELDNEMLKDFYGVDPEWLTAYVCSVPMMNVHATEFFAAHVKDGQMDNVKAAIEARKASLDATWSMYLPAQYELVQNSITEVNGSFILFAVTEHADSIKTIFAEATK